MHICSRAHRFMYTRLYTYTRTHSHTVYIYFYFYGLPRCNADHQKMPTSSVDRHVFATEVQSSTTETRTRNCKVEQLSASDNSRSQSLLCDCAAAGDCMGPHTKRTRPNRAGLVKRIAENKNETMLQLGLT